MSAERRTDDPYRAFGTPSDVSGAETRETRSEVEEERAMEHAGERWADELSDDELDAMQADSDDA